MPQHNQTKLLTQPSRTLLALLLLQSWFLVTSTRASRLFPITLGASPGLSLGNEEGNGSDNNNNNNNNGDNESDASVNGTLRCDRARLLCAYRTGCGMALQHYLTKCTSVLQGDDTECPENCQHALIALTSTDEGKDLMKCVCAENDKMCHLSKQRVEICRSSVIRTMNRTRVSCRVATWICNADATCSTALQYYNENCKRMFHGKKCTKRCRNSLNILRRQEKAAKLNTCFCDGAEEYECKSIHRNMNSLCYGMKIHREYQKEPDDNPRLTKKPKDDDYNSRANSPNSLVNSSWTILLSCLVLLLQLQGTSLARNDIWHR